MFFSLFYFGENGHATIMLLERRKERRFVFRKAMDELIRGLYMEMLKENNPGEKISRRTKKTVLNVLQEDEMQMADDGKDILWSKAFMIASGAEEDGFVEGFRCAFRLILDCVLN